MNKYLFLIYILFGAIIAKAQNVNTLAFAKYKNGVFYVGEKVTEKENIIGLKLNTNDTIRINRNELSRYFDGENAIIYQNGKHHYTKGRFWNVSFGFNALDVIDSVDDRASAQLEFLYGHRLSEKINIGIGASIEFNEALVSGFQFDTQFLTLFAYGRYYLNQNSKRLFVFSRLGFGFPAEENEEDVTIEHSGGFNSLNGLGIHFAARKKSRFLIQLGYYTQKTEGREFFLDPIGNEIDTSFDILIKRLIFKFGWEFG